jgi:hypothetical protein
MEYVNPLNIADYLAAAEVTPINPKYKTLVKKFAQAHRRVDFHVDSASLIEDQIDDDSPESLRAQHRIYLKLEEKWFDKAGEIQSELPNREIANVWKQLIKATGVK